jgi:uncharacterized membrane protein YecN with MAPEG domain
MKQSLKKAATIFKYLFVLFTIIFWIGVVIDDYSLIQNYWKSNWSGYLETWFLYFITFSAAFTFYYWTAAIIIILIFKFKHKTQVK